MRQKTNDSNKDTSIRTRRAIVNLLKEHGTLDAAALADRIDISTDGCSAAPLRLAEREACPLLRRSACNVQTG